MRIGWFASIYQGGWAARPFSNKKRSLFDIHAEKKARGSAFFCRSLLFLNDLVYPLRLNELVRRERSITECHCPWVHSGEWFPWPQQIRVYCIEKERVQISFIFFHWGVIWNHVEGRVLYRICNDREGFKEACWGRELGKMGKMVSIWCYCAHGSISAPSLSLVELNRRVTYVQSVGSLSHATTYKKK